VTAPLPSETDFILTVKLVLYTVYEIFTATVKYRYNI